ncbi:MAG: hypothetical protein IKJ79_07675 [Bacteroidaceae bacterium]|nr:hypothetical protein [Bacteroidaceae bacterium]
MKNLLKLTWSITMIGIVAVLTGCDLNNNNTPSVYYTDFVTTHIDIDESLFFEQVLRNDLGSVMLYPYPTIKGKLYEGQRVLLQYYVKEEKPDNNKEVEIMNIYSVRHDTIIDAHPDTIAAYPDDPVKVNTISRTGNYINLDISIEYFNKSHGLNLFSNPMQAPSDTIDVILRHNNNNDAHGYWATAYASFYIPNLARYRAMRVYANTPNDPLGYFIIKIKD